MFGLVIATALLLSASQPANAPPVLPANAHVPVAPAQVLEIPPALMEDFRLQVLSKSHVPHRRLELLAKYLFLPGGLGIKYDHNATYTVAQAYEHRLANCLTFTLLTVALAREARLEAYGQDMSESLVWVQDETATYRTTHVNAGIRIDARRFTLDVASDQVLSRNPPRRIADARLLAQYYNNRSAELMAQGQLELALAYSKVAVQQDPLYSAVWNNGGVYFGRTEQPREAERYYLRALELNADDASALTNLSQLYLRTGEIDKARPLQKRLRVVQDHNPFHQFMLALSAEHRGELEDANRFYRRAIRLHRNEHRFHFGLARTYFKLGKPEAASRALLRARELSEGATRNIYQAKLDNLSRGKS